MANFLYPLFNWTNGVIMIGVFVLVVIVLIGVLVNFMTSGKGKENHETQ